MSHGEYTSILGSIGLLLLGLVISQFLSRNKLPLAPGPPRKLFTGNIQQLPKSENWKTYAEWGKIYGSVISFSVFGREFIILNSAKAAVDLLDLRSSIYSDRPASWMGTKLIGRELNVFNISSHNPRFRNYRKQLHSGLNSRATQTYIPLINQESRVLLQGIASAPENFITHIRRNAGAVILKITYGWTVSDNNDLLVNTMEEAARITAGLYHPGKWLVEFIPWLRFLPSWAPGAGFKRKASQIKERMKGIDQTGFNWTKEQIQSGNYIESFTSNGLQPEDGEPLSAEAEDILKWCSAGLYAGGADTTVSAMTTFFFQMTLHPEIQQRARDEIESVVGKGVFPTIDNKKDLPYTMALMKEMLRFAPVAPLGLPHRVTQDDVYEGYRIPRGSTVFANIWGIMHDSEMYPNPLEFDPERFLGAEPQQDTLKWVFGFGRRICPGAHFAETNMFLNMTSILVAFNIAKAVDKDGREVDPEVHFTTGITSHLKPFECRITPRSPDLLASLSSV